MKLDTSQITGLILAGGRGSRMGGVDKGMQSFRGKPMVAHVIERFAPQVGSLMISANQNPQQYRAFGLPVWQDRVAGFEGPLAGMQAGLLHCATEFLATAPCDTPFLPPDLVARLGVALVAQQAQAAVAVTHDEQGRRQPHPVCCLLRRALLPSLDAYLQDGRRKIGDWHRALRVAEVDFPDDAAFRNINTLEELRRFEAT